MTRGTLALESFEEGLFVLELEPPLFFPASPIFDLVYTPTLELAAPALADKLPAFQCIFDTTFPRFNVFLELTPPIVILELLPSPTLL